MSNLFTCIRFFMALLTVLALVGKPHIPPKTLVIHPSANTEASLYGPLDAGGLLGTTWLDKAGHYMRCEMPIARGPAPCGMAFGKKAVLPTTCARYTGFVRCSSADADLDGDGWGSEEGKTCVVFLEQTNRPVNGDAVCNNAASDDDGDGWGWENNTSCIVMSDVAKETGHPPCASAKSDPDGDGWGWENEQSCRVVETAKEAPCTDEELTTHIDAKGYDGLLVKVQYEGRAQHLNLVVTDAAPRLLALGVEAKPMGAHLSVEELRAGAVFVELDRFEVPEWWVLGQNPPRDMARPNFSHVVQVAFDTGDQGIHRLRVEEIKLVGERIDTETYLLIIAMVWAGYLLFEGGLRYYRLHSALQHEQDLLKDLAGSARQLEDEKTLLEHRTLTDPLTGALNRNGMAHRLDQQYGTQQLPAGTGLMVFDLDHFKKLNDTYGHDAGDDVLQDFAALISSAIRAEDIFARWGGEEFVLVVDPLPVDKLSVVAEKLRQQVAEHPFLQAKQLKVTVSIGVAKSHSEEPFSTLFKRADTALYQAKMTRNSVTHAP